MILDLNVERKRRRKYCLQSHTLLENWKSRFSCLERLSGLFSYTTGELDADLISIIQNNNLVSTPLSNNVLQGENECNTHEKNVGFTRRKNEEVSLVMEMTSLLSLSCHSFMEKSI